MYNNIVCSPSGILSPPNLYGDSCARNSTPGGLGRSSSFDMGACSMEDRFSSLETRSALNQTEIGMLRDSVQEMSKWRTSMCVASDQTSDLLRCLDEDIGALKEQIVQSDKMGDASSLEEKVESYAVELAHLKTLECVQGQLDTVDSRLKEAERILVDRTIFEDELSEVKSKMSELEVLSESAAAGVAGMQTDIQHVVESMDTLQDSVDDAECKIETIRLALEVVEQSLDDFNESEIVESIRSRMDDLDVGIENVARDSESRMKELSARVDALKEELDASMVSKKVDEAFEIAQATSLELSDLKRDLKHGRFGTGSASGASTPSSVSLRSSDARVKAAVHTLSDGYRSLHKAMGLMYEEHAQLSQRMSRAGLDAHEGPREMHLMEKIRADDARCPIQSFPIDISEDSDAPVAADDDDLRVLLAAQVKDSQRAEKRIESLEDEVRQLRQILKSFVSSSMAISSQSPPVRMNMRWSPTVDAYKVTLSCS